MALRVAAALGAQLLVPGSAAAGTAGERAPVRLNEAGPVAQLGAGERVDDEDGWQLGQAVEARHLGALLRLVGHLTHRPCRRSTLAAFACSAPHGRAPGSQSRAVVNAGCLCVLRATRLVKPSADRVARER
jgi:hypothetical protein